MSTEKVFTQLANTVSRWAGSPGVFILALLSVVVWAMSGPFFGFSDTWELVINTGTTIVTFLMVFLIQNTQNRDSSAIHAKLDELIRGGKAHNRFIGIEHLTDKEIQAILDTCEKQGSEELRCEGEAVEKAEVVVTRKADTV